MQLISMVSTGNCSSYQTTNLARNRKLWNKQSATSAHLVVVHRHAVGHQVADGHDRSVPLIRQLQCRNGYKRRQ